MQLIIADRNRRVINGQQEIKFSSYSSFHLIKLTARAKSENQLGVTATDDEDLTFTLDGRSFPKLGTKNDLIDAPTAFSGGSLHGLTKTVYLFNFLRGRDHRLIFNTDKPSSTAAFESVEVFTFSPSEILRLDVLHQAEDGNRRPWLTFALVDLPLASFSVGLTLEKRFLDSDDVKVSINGKIILNHRNLWRKLWYFVAASLGDNQQVHSFPTDLPTGLHYLELFADRMPILNNVVFNFGVVPSTLFTIPTADNPKWTNDFYDDSEEILLARVIYGEAGGESYEAKIAVGWTIRNRVEDKLNRWGRTYHDVLLAEYQYDSLWNKDTYDKVRNPAINNDPGEIDAWKESYKVALMIVQGEAADPTAGANHFYSATTGKPNWADEQKITLEIGITRFYKL